MSSTASEAGRQAGRQRGSRQTEAGPKKGGDGWLEQRYAPWKSSSGKSCSTDRSIGAAAGVVVVVAVVGGMRALPSCVGAGGGGWLLGSRAAGEHGR